jgi:hypothetical protein
MIKSRSKKLLTVVLALIVIGVAVALIMWNKPNRTVANEKGIEVTAVQLVKEYQENEQEANKKYLDKALQVSGTISAVDKNQEGQTTVMLTSDDAMTGVLCTLKEQAGNIAAGSSITIKGFCSGMLSDVRLREAVVVK